MLRHILTLTLTGVLGVVLTAGEAQACHKPKCKTTVAYVPAPVACAPVAKKCGFKMPKMSMPKFGCHKKAAVACAPTTYVAATPQSVAPSAQMTYPAAQTK